MAHEKRRETLLRDRECKMFSAFVKNIETRGMFLRLPLHGPQALSDVRQTSATSTPQPHLR